MSAPFAIADANLRVTAAELVAMTAVGVCAALVLNAYLLDLAGFPLALPALLLVLAMQSLSVGWLLRGRLHIVYNSAELIGFFLVAVGIGVYLLWLAAPTFLPIAFSFDLAHHLTIIEYIQQQRSLAHDPALQPYLEVNYTPGSHIIAAVVAMLLNLPALLVVHPLVALFGALKAGMIYNTILRMQVQRNTAVALAGTMFLLVVHKYFISSFTFWGFYAQVVSEVFLVAMLWALLTWYTTTSRLMLHFWTLCGSAVYLIWPLWLPIPIITLVFLLIIRRAQSWRAKLVESSLSIIPILVIALTYTAARLDYASTVLVLEGGVTKPLPSVFGEVFLILFAFGMIVSLRRQLLRPLHLFAAITILQTVALLAFDLRINEVSFYLPLKMIYLLFYAMLLFVALALADLWRAVEQAIAPRFSQVSVLSLLVPVLVLLLAVQRGLPVPAGSPQTAQLYDAAQWARDHLPRACVAYLVDDKERAYWLHVAVLGNPRDTPRVDELLRTHDRARVNELFWSDERALPYAIVPAARMLPAEARARFDLLYASGEAIVVQRKAANSCPPEVVPLDRVAVAPRGWTLAGALAAMLPK